MRIKNVVIAIVAMLFTTVSFAGEKHCYVVEMEIGVAGDPTIVWVTTTPVTGKMSVVSCEFEADLYSQDSGYDMVKALTFIKEELAWILGDSGIAEIDQRLQNLKSNC